MLSSLALFFIITIPNIADGNISFVMDKIGTGGMLTAVVTAVFTAWIFNVASNHSMFKKIQLCLIWLWLGWMHLFQLQLHWLLV